MNLWDSGVWSFVSTLAVLLGVMLLANGLRNICGFIRRMIIPSSVLGGFILLLINFVCKHYFDFSLYSTDTLEILTYHGLGLGFAALALRNTPKKTDGRSRTGALDSGLAVVNGYLLQGVVGLAISVTLYYVIGSFYASGTLLPMGYGQGPGQAYNWGHNYEFGSWAAPFVGGFKNGTSFGLTVAAMGFVSESIGGVIYLNRLKKKGIFKGKLGADVKEELTLDTFTGKNEVPLAESMDKFTIQIALVFLAYFLAYILMVLFNKLLDPAGTGASGIKGTLQGMVWGFQFLFSTLTAMAIMGTLNALRKKGEMSREYTNNFMQNRISGFMFDLMVVASIAAIDLRAFEEVEFILPLSLMCIAGAVVTYFYIGFVCKRVFPEYEHEAFLSLYGMQTGTASTGVILLRELDPQFRTQASDNMVYHMPWAILFGVPLFLLVGVAPQSVGKSILTLVVCATLFIVYNIVLLRKRIFKRKNKK